MLTAYRSTGFQDDSGVPDQDLAFVGVDMLNAPPNVAPGFACAAINKRMVQDGQSGAGDTRRGLFSPAWGYLWSATFPYRRDFTTGINDRCWATGTFSDPNELRLWIVAAGQAGLYFFRETEVARYVPYPLGQTINAPAQIVQQFDQLFIYRSDGGETLVWPGNWALPVAASAVTAPAGNPYAPMPPGLRGEAWRDRNVVFADDNTLILSRIADYSQYDKSDNNPSLITQYFVNRGTGDRLRAMKPMAQFSLFLLKTKSAHIFSAAQGDLSDAALDEMSRDIEFDAPNTVIMVDGVVWWLDRRGVRSAVLTDVNKIHINPQPVSARIDPLIRRINWAAVSTASAVLFQNRAYFAVPLDHETTPKHVLVYNLLTQQWEGMDQWDRNLNFDIIGWAVSDWLGQPRLFAISSTMQLACYEYGLGEDYVYPSKAAIADLLTTRGYTSGERSKKKWTRCEIQVDTWNPSVALTATFDGANNVMILAPIVRDPTAYFTATDIFDLQNLDGRSEDPGRQDYAVAPAAAGVRLDTVQAGISLEIFQSMAERRGLNEREAAWVQLTIANTGGSCRIRYVGVESTAGDRSNLQAA